MTSDISCRSCRRRKVKCDRRFPQCLVCEQTAQDCNYPPGPLKPGPKIGSKRPREDGPNIRGIRDVSIQRSEQTVSELPGRQSLGPDTSGETHYPEIRSSSQSRERQGRSPPSDDREDNMRRISDLSFILHPSHETSSPDKERISSTQHLPSDARNSAALDKARSMLCLGEAAIERLVTTYFDNMVAINLFHEPSFCEKLSMISSPTQICALLSALRSFAVRFSSYEDDDAALGDSQASINDRAAYYLDQTASYINEALKECGDSTPSMCILQACIVSTHCQLSQGVLGRAWRSLGTCVRLAYEMNLHLVDTETPSGVPETPVEQWCEDEEKRRAWWAVWEMDVFATTIRRTPTAVSWSQIDTLLPVEDSYWFERKPRPSCFLEKDPICRWKALQRSGNQSAKAWFIVINSLMKDAQRISSPRGVPGALGLNGSPASSVHSRNDYHPDRINAARRRLELIENAVQCFRLALPNHLKYHNQYLGFEPRAPAQYMSARQEHCGIYNIYMMTHLARLMIHRFDAFGKRFKAAISSHDLDASADSRERAHAREQKDWAESLAIKQYFEAADDLLSIVRRSCEDHVRYINPFLSSTIWLASAVLLVRSQFCPHETTRSVIKSRYEVMHLTYKKCVDFWDMQTAVQQNLETLEQRLEACERPDSSDQEPPGSHGRPSRTRGRSGTSNNIRRLQRHRGRSPHAPRGNADSSISQVPESDNISASSQSAQPPLSPPSSHGFQQPAWPPNATSPDVSALDFMHLAPQQQVDSQPAPSSFAGETPNALVDPLVFGHATLLNAPPSQSTDDSAGVGLEFDWTFPRLPTDLQDMLSGFFTT